MDKNNKLDKEYYYLQYTIIYSHNVLLFLFSGLNTVYHLSGFDNLT